ncbi:MAG: enoyl-CoA hydratase/isomerase family protein [Acidobacteriota bacterium]|jgi:enoyl-CoA hydratase/carnithine racemase
MAYATLEREGDLATITLQRGKVNAIDAEAIRDLQETFDIVRADDTLRGAVLTGAGAFFSFGFDIPTFLPLPPEPFTAFLTGFTAFYRDLFLFPKPVVAALNGHTVAGGCMLALACDRRVMAAGKAKIGLNEITFGATAFAGSVEVLRAVVGHRNAERVVLTGAMFLGEEAVELGLVDRVVDPEDLVHAAGKEAEELASKDPAAYRSLKRLLRGPVAERMRAEEEASIREFVEIWYSPSTRHQMKRIQIRE